MSRRGGPRKKSSKPKVGAPLQIAPQEAPHPLLSLQSGATIGLGSLGLACAGFMLIGGAFIVIGAAMAILSSLLICAVHMKEWRDAAKAGIWRRHFIFPVGMVAMVTLLVITISFKDHILSITGHDPPSIETAQRKFYRDSVKKNDTKAGFLLIQVETNQWDSHEEFLIANKIISWGTETGLWLCNNMGIGALSHFYQHREDSAPLDTFHNIDNVNMKMLNEQRLNLEDIVNQGTWDPSGDIVKPKMGCRSGVRGDPNDPLANIVDQPPWIKTPSELEKETLGSGH
jgi:hypothetical protein